MFFADPDPNNTVYILLVECSIGYNYIGSTDTDNLEPKDAAPAEVDLCVNLYAVDCCDHCSYSEVGEDGVVF